MIDGRIYLKVKIINLADEDRTITRLARRVNNSQKWSMISHGRFVVKPEARAAQLAYAFIRGVPYSKLERNPRSAPDWKRVEQLVRKYAIDNTIILADLRTRRWKEDLDENEIKELDKFLKSVTSGELLESILKDLEVWKSSKSHLPSEPAPQSSDSLSGDPPKS